MIHRPVNNPVKRFLFIVAALAAFWTASVATAFVLIQPSRFASAPAGTWHELTAFAGTDSAEALGQQDYLVWFVFTPAADGNIDALKVKVGAYTANTNVKLGLYQNSAGDALLASGTVLVTGTGEFTATITATAVVTSATYRLAIIGDLHPGGIQIAYKSGTGTFYYGDSAVPYYTLEDPIPSASGTDTKTWALAYRLQ